MIVSPAKTTHQSQSTTTSALDQVLLLSKTCAQDRPMHVTASVQLHPNDEKNANRPEVQNADHLGYCTACTLECFNNLRLTINRKRSRFVHKRSKTCITYWKATIVVIRNCLTSWSTRELACAIINLATNSPPPSVLNILPNTSA